MLANRASARKKADRGGSLVFIDGFTAIETIIAIALFALIVVAISPLFTAASRSWEKDKRLKEQIQKARDAMDFISYELKKSNGIMDNRWNLDFSVAGLSTLDPNYVAFSSAGDEIVLDDKNSGYKSNGTVNSVTGTGFANDYDAADNNGYATYEFKTVLPGLYDLQAYFISTATANALDLSQTTISTVGNVEFYYWLNTEDKHDAFIVQMSSSGGNNLAIPFTGVATQCVGKIKDGQTDTGSACVTGSDRIDPNYNSTVADASSTINAQRAFQSDNRSWRKVTAQLTDFVGTYSLLRFYWEADSKKAGTEYSGLYLDNIAVWYNWGGGIFEKTLERKSWKGNSNAGTNWGTSTANYGSPGYFNGIGTN